MTLTHCRCFTFAHLRAIRGDLISAGQARYRARMSVPLMYGPVRTISDYAGRVCDGCNVEASAEDAGTASSCADAGARRDWKADAGQDGGVEREQFLTGHRGLLRAVGSGWNVPHVPIGEARSLERLPTDHQWTAILERPSPQPGGRVPCHRRCHDVGPSFAGKRSWSSSLS